MLNRRDAITLFAYSGLTGLYCSRREAFGKFEPTPDARDQRLRDTSLRAMGSEINIRWEDDPEHSLTETQVRKSVRDLLEKWNSILSDYDDESEASVITKPVNLGQWQTVSIELAEALSRSKKWYDTSEGAFDVTCGAVTALRRRRRLANPDEWKSAIQTMGWEGIEWKPDDRKIRINRDGLKFDFGGIGKGLAVDKVCSLLNEMGLTRFIVNFAGNLRAARAPHEREGWPVEIEVLEPNQSESGRTYKFRIADQSMASSGDQFQNFPDWKSQSPKDRSSHILDPRDGGGLRGRQLVTISTEEASDADAAATAACVQLQRGNQKWIDNLCDSGEFLGIAQQLVEGKRTEHEFGGFFEKLKVVRS